MLKGYLFFILFFLFIQSTFGGYNALLFCYEKDASLSTHVWGHFWEEENPQNGFTISWYPNKENYKVLDGRVEGKNLTLEETINSCSRANVKIYYWGFKITDKCFVEAKEQHRKLKAGEYLYNVLDKRSRNDKAINCIHAISDIAGYLETNGAIGDVAVIKIIDHYQRKGYIKKGLPLDITKDLYENKVKKDL